MNYYDEREDALAQDALSDTQYARAAVNQYADVYGAVDTSRAWILSPYDTWERNPHYNGPAVRHPEDDCDDDVYLDAPDVADHGDDDIPF